MPQLLDQLAEHVEQARTLANVEPQHAQEIADRIRSLRDESEETNHSIADYCGVG